MFVNKSNASKFCVSFVKKTTQFISAKIRIYQLLTSFTRIMCHIARKPALGVLWPGKNETDLLGYRSYLGSWNFRYYFYISAANNRDTDQTARMCWLICIFVVNKIHVISPSLAHWSRRLTRWACSIVRLCRPSSSSILSNKYISKTSWPILVKFYQKHLWSGGKAA